MRPDYVRGAFFVSKGGSMKIKLNKSFARSGKVDEYDVKQVKKVLNRLGYYQPYEKTGIMGVPDSAVFTALKQFQKDNGLKPTGTA
jgi:peptidoglycan hydrolase-like protein with peptidoglycan-binding domain